MKDGLTIGGAASAAGVTPDDKSADGTPKNGRRA